MYYSTQKPYADCQIPSSPRPRGDKLPGLGALATTQNNSAGGRTVGATLAVSILFAPALCVAQDIDINRPGGDYRIFATMGTAADCKLECENEPVAGKCRAYGFVKPGYAGNEAICALKDSIPLPVQNPCCASGVVRQEVCVHGNGGQLQDHNVDAGSYGWGFRYRFAGGFGSWISYSIPTYEADMIIDGIVIAFSISAPKDGWIDSIHLWDGGDQLYRWDDVDYGKSEGPNDPIRRRLILPLPEPKRVTKGIGISLRPETMDYPGIDPFVTFDFHSVCVMTVE